MSFVDEIQIHVRGGHGGAGFVHFRREKSVPFGGPDGGDGGRGGNVVIRTHTALQSLGHFKNNLTFFASAGVPGGPNNMTGANADDLVLSVPPGTEIVDADTDETLCDLATIDSRFIVANGGKGGRGNTHFVNSVNQAPTYAQPGLPGDERRLILRLKLMADAGLVGFPNAGKSTFIASISQSKTKIADYPFTTLIPHLGVVEKEFRRILLADIPGIIEGAHKGAGLGISFLRHIERVRVILYVVDIGSMDPAEELRILKNELHGYSPELLTRPALLIVNKADTIEYDSSLEKSIAESLAGEALKLDAIYFVSALEKKGLDQVIERLFQYFPDKTFAESMLVQAATVETQIEGEQ